MSGAEDALASTIDACAVLARRNDPDRFLCAMCLPAETRSLAFALIAFNAEIAKATAQTVSSAVAGPMAGLIRLQWWRDIIREPGRRFQTRHDVAMALGQMVEEGRTAPEPLLSMLDARENELYGMPDWAAWRGVMLEGAGALQRAQGMLMGLADPCVLERIAQVGAAYSAGALLRHLPAVLHGGRPALPAQALSAVEGDGEPEPGVPALIMIADQLRIEGRAFLANHAAAVRECPPSERRAFRLATLPAILAARDLERSPVAPGAERGLGDRMAVAWGAFRAR